MHSSSVLTARATTFAVLVLVSGCSSSSATPPIDPTTASTLGGATGAPSMTPAANADRTGTQRPSASPDSEVVVARPAGRTCSAGFIAYVQRGTAGTGDLAMAVTLTYCGTGTRTFETFPTLTVSDTANRPLIVTITRDKKSAPTTPLIVARSEPVCFILSWKADTPATPLHAATITVAPTTGRAAFAVGIDATLNATSPVLVTSAWVASSGDCIGS